MSTSAPSAPYLNCPFCKATGRKGCLSCESKAARPSNAAPAAPPAAPPAPPPPPSPTAAAPNTEPSPKAKQLAEKRELAKSENKIVSMLTTLPADDHMFRTALTDASDEELATAHALINGKTGHKTRARSIQFEIEKRQRHARQAARSAPAPTAAPTPVGVAPEVMQKLHDRIMLVGAADLDAFEAKLPALTQVTAAQMDEIRGWVSERRAALSTPVTPAPVTPESPTPESPAAPEPAIPETATPETAVAPPAPADPAEPQVPEAEEEGAQAGAEDAEESDEDLCGCVHEVDDVVFDEVDADDAAAAPPPPPPVAISPAERLRDVCMGPEYEELLATADARTLEAALELMLPDASRHLMKMRVLAETANRRGFMKAEDATAAVRQWVLCRTPITDAAFAQARANATEAELERILSLDLEEERRAALTAPPTVPADLQEDPADPTQDDLPNETPVPANTTVPDDPDTAPADPPVVENPPHDDPKPAQAVATAVPDTTCIPIDRARPGTTIPVPLIQDDRGLEHFSDDRRMLIRKVGEEKWNLLRRLDNFGKFAFVTSGVDPIELWMQLEPAQDAPTAEQAA